MTPEIFYLPGNKELANQIANQIKGNLGELNLRHFPDGETYVQLLTDVKDKQIFIVSTLHQPDEKLIPLYFLAKTALELGARNVCLIAPYLAYMRQDKRFHPGEGITSTYFGALISQFANSIITVDPHLHRRSSLSEVYSIPNKVVHAAGIISKYIKENIASPLLIGPDMESEQWVSEVAKNADAPYIVLSKIRHGDNDVEVSVPQVEKYKDHTPVLVDDIISTGHTMMETIGHLKKAGMKNPICIGVHAVFAGTAYDDLKIAGADEIITCNTIPHESNGIEITGLLIDGIKELYPEI